MGGRDPEEEDEGSYRKDDLDLIFLGTRLIRAGTQTAAGSVH
jgi:hypothetical protein